MFNNGTALVIHFAPHDPPVVYSGKIGVRIDVEIAFTLFPNVYLYVIAHKLNIGFLVGVR